MAKPIIDAHHHFWDPAGGGDYGWLSGPFEAINRRFEPADLRPALKAKGVAGTVLVQTLNDLRETHRFLRTAEETDFIAGVVGWVDLTAADVAEQIEGLKEGPQGRWLAGIRHLIHHEPDPDWLAGEAPRRGIAAVQAAGLVYDFVPNVPHLPGCLRVAKAFPEQRFVLDHLSKPDIRNHGFDAWAPLIRSFRSERGHVWCKLSGMVTEADWTSWTPADLKPYVHEALDVFGVERCMFGSDWPVCIVAGSYERVVDALRECLKDLGQAELDRIFGENAIEAYRLPEFQAG